MEQLAWVVIGVAVALWIVSWLVRALASGRSSDGHLSGEIKHTATSTPPLPPVYSEGLPVVGNVKAFMSGPMQFARRGHQACGEVFTLRLGWKRLTFLVGPAAHAVFFRATDEELDQAPVYSFSVPVFGEGVVYDAPLPVRLEQFRFVSTALRPSRLREYVPWMVREAESYFQRHWVGDSGTADLLQSLSQLIILTASRCLMGREVREHLFEEVSQLYHDLDQGMQPLSVFAPHAPTRAHWRRDRAHRQMKRLFHRVMQERRQRYAAEAERAQREGRDGQVAIDAVKEADMLQTFMDATYKSGKPLSDDEITGLLIAVLFAGQHTSTITGSWTGLLALRDAAVVQQLHEEQAQVLVDERGQFAIDYDRLLRLDRLHRCIKEALRMYPPLIFIMRKVMQPRQYQQYTIPTGDILVVSPSISMRLPQVFAEPDRYDPERYAPPREEDKQAPFSHIGFGGGRHACMGEQFAYLQIKTIWSVLLRDFDMEAVGALPQPDYDAMVVGPKPPCLVRWRRRERNGGNV